MHRDLKPGNIMLTKAGSSKLLDFGLARLKQPGVTPAYTSVSALPTEAADLTAKGAILHEMVSGKRAFEGKSQVSLIGAILEREPAPISTLQPSSPRPSIS
jgi:serine/threonine protein kinase